MKRFYVTVYFQDGTVYREPQQYSAYSAAQAELELARHYPTAKLIGAFPC